MAKTTLEIANDLNVTKQRVYRYIKKHNITEAYQEAGVMYYDEVVQKAVREAFNGIDKKNEAPHEVTHEARNDALSEALIKQVEIKDIQLQNKDKQIEDLTKLLDQQQHLLLMNAKQKETLEIELKEAKEIKPRWWQRSSK